MENKTKDFFISYTKSDEQWATWIAGTRTSFPGTKTVKFPGIFPHNNLPFNQNPHFSGRREVLDDIHNTFTKQESDALTQAIAGLGGV